MILNQKLKIMHVHPHVTVLLHLPCSAPCCNSSKSAHPQQNSNYSFQQSRPKAWQPVPLLVVVEKLDNQCTFFLTTSVPSCCCSRNASTKSQKAKLLFDLLLPLVLFFFFAGLPIHCPHSNPLSASFQHVWLWFWLLWFCWPPSNCFGRGRRTEKQNQKGIGTGTTSSHSHIFSCIWFWAW